jgi:hypothetical protein
MRGKSSTPPLKLRDSVLSAANALDSCPGVLGDFRVSAHILGTKAPPQDRGRVSDLIRLRSNSWGILEPPRPTTASAFANGSRGHPPELERSGSGRHDRVLRRELPQPLLVLGLDHR